jgi:hypothetical protein
MQFGEHNSQLSNIYNRTEAENSIEEMVVHNMTFDLNVFSALVKVILMYNLNHTLIVVEYGRGRL